MWFDETGHMELYFWPVVAVSVVGELLGHFYESSGCTWVCTHRLHRNLILILEYDRDDERNNRHESTSTWPPQTLARLLVIVCIQKWQNLHTRMWICLIGFLPRKNNFFPFEVVWWYVSGKWSIMSVFVGGFVCRTVPGSLNYSTLIRYQ